MLPKSKKKDFYKFIKSPMPGLVNAVTCKTGDFVTENQELFIVGKYQINLKKKKSISSKSICRGNENAKFHYVPR